MTTQKTISFSPAYALTLIILMLPFAYAAFFTFPAGDDFARSLLAGHLFDVVGGFKEMFRAWMRWSGRYTHHFLIVFLGDAALWRVSYAAICLANMLLHYVALAGICREIAAPSPRGTAATLALFLLFSLAATHGSIQSSWYLLTDILCLGVAVGFTLTYIWSLCVMWNVPVPARKHKIFCIVSCIVSVGCYEYSAVMAVLISVTAYLLARTHGHRHLLFFRTMCVVSSVCLLLSFFSRGNFRRRTKRDVDNAVMMTQFATVWADWCRHIAPKIITPLYLSLIVWAAWLTPKSEADATAKVRTPWVILYCFAAACGFLAIMAVIHTSSDVPLGAAGKIPAHMSIFCAMIFGSCLLACRNAFHLVLLRKIPLCLLFLVCLAPLISSYNFRTILWNEATGALEQYAGAREIRKAYLQASAGENVTVAPIDILPFPVGSAPINADPAVWPGRYISKLYSLKTFVRNPGTRQPPSPPIPRRPGRCCGTPPVFCRALTV